MTTHGQNGSGKTSHERPVGAFMAGGFCVLTIIGVIWLVYRLGGLAPSGTGSDKPIGFFDAFTAPLWIVLIVNVATLISAGGAAWAALKVTPKTSRDIADQTDARTGQAIEVAKANAEAARTASDASARSAEAAKEQAAAAVRVAEETGIHAIARLRQAWIDELRSRVAQAHALLANWTPDTSTSTPDSEATSLRRTIEANEALTKVELLLNPNESESAALVSALHGLSSAGSDLPARQAASRKVIDAAQVVLKKEWRRVKDELKGQKTADRMEETSVNLEVYGEQDSLASMPENDRILVENTSGAPPSSGNRG